MSPAARGPLRIVILISGRGSNMLAIARAALCGRLSATVAAVISDRADAPGLASARELGLECQLVSVQPGEARDDYDRRLAAAVRAFAPDVVVLAGFMRILGAAFVHEYAGRLLNIHPSLLPKYRGLHTHQRVLDARENEHGCSVHFVTEELDGGPVVIQARVAVEPGDTVQSLSARVQREEHRIYPMTLDWLATGRLQWRVGTPWLDDRRLATPVVLESSVVAS
jgi:phosphoribosylglycinamide formyltransferase-1